LNRYLKDLTESKIGTGNGS